MQVFCGLGTISQCCTLEEQRRGIRGCSSPLTTLITGRNRCRALAAPPLGHSHPSGDAIEIISELASLVARNFDGNGIRSPSWCRGRHESKTCSYSWYRRRRRIIIIRLNKIVNPSYHQVSNTSVRHYKAEKLDTELNCNRQPKLLIRTFQIFSHWFYDF